MTYGTFFAEILIGGVMVLLCLLIGLHINTVSLRIPYGPETIGVLVEKEMPPIGPYGFTVDHMGSLIIPDPVNGDVKRIDRDGKISSIVPLKGYFDDIEVDPSGKILILDRSRSLIIYLDPSSPKAQELELDPQTVITPTKFFKWKGNIYLNNIDFPHLIDPQTKSGVLPKPLHIDLSEENLQITPVQEKGVPEEKINLTVRNLLSAEFLGQDKDGNYYIQVEKARGETSVELSVLVVDPEGKIIEAIDIPRNDYFVWTSRLLYLDEKGNIYQVLPASDAIYINIWEVK